MADHYSSDDWWSNLMGFVGVVAFFASWIYAISTYGWFLGLSLGWIPSIIIAFVLYWLTPLLFGLMLIALVILLLWWSFTAQSTP
jgi:hypothetical protein